MKQRCFLVKQHHAGGSSCRKNLRPAHWLLAAGMVVSLSMIQPQKGNAVPFMSPMGGEAIQKSWESQCDRNLKLDRSQPLGAEQKVRWEQCVAEVKKRDADTAQKGLILTLVYGGLIFAGFSLADRHRRKLPDNTPPKP